MENKNYRWVRTASIDNGDDYQVMVEQTIITQADNLDDLQPPHSFEFGAGITNIHGGILSWESGLSYEYELLDPNDDTIEDQYVRNMPSLDDDTIVVAIGNIMHVKEFPFNTPCYVVGAWKNDLPKRQFSRERAEAFAMQTYDTQWENNMAHAVKDYLKL